jgi:hypothetical protein
MEASSTTFERQAHSLRPKLAYRICLSILFLAAATEFALRGPVRFLSQSPDWNDLVPVYIPARVWLQGGNPYDPNAYAGKLSDTFNRPWNSAAPRSHAVYPLSTFVLLAPIAALPWKIAQPIWATTLVVLIIAMLVSLNRAEGLDRERAWIFAILTLALAPFHTGLATGNISVAAVALAGLLISALHSGNRWAGGLYLAAMVGLKPQIGLPLLLYYALRRHWLPCSIAVGGTLLTFLIGTLRLSQVGTVWTHDFARNIHVFVGSNVYDDFTSKNPIRFTLIDLQVPFSSFADGRTLPVALALALTAGLAVLWLAFFLKERNPDDLLNVSAIAILSLLPVYHRFYDASLLALPLCWTLSASSASYKRVCRVCWILGAPFLIPGASIMQQASSAGKLPDALLNSWFWKFLVMPHENWALLALVLTLLWAMKLRLREQATSRRIEAFPRESAN